MNVKVSVIIPIYNAAAHLEQCVASLLAQTLVHCEYIFVNDGSKDNSQSIIEDFQKKDNRIVLFNQENQGVSAARNRGIENSRGEFISFVDADDYVENDFLEVLYSTLKSNKIQIVVSNFITELDGRIIPEKTIFSPNKVYSKLEIQNQIIPFFIKDDRMNTACNKMYDANLIKTNQLVFPKGITNGEDGLFNLQVFNKANSAFFIDYNGYFYREVPNSATRNTTNKDYFQLALNQFNYDYYNQYHISIDNVELTKLKSIRLLNTVVALINIYINSNFNILKKYKIISKILSNPLVQKGIKNYWQEIIFDKGKYQQFILYCIKIKSIVLLYIATKYSNYRNKK